MSRGAYLRIVDAGGNRIPKAALGRDEYEGSTSGRRLNTWGTSTAGPNAALFSSLTTLRSRSRQMVRNDPQASGGLDTLVANLVGTGITPRWQIEDPDLKKEIQDLWEDWVLEADSDEIYDFYGLQSLMTRSMIEGGETLVRFRAQDPYADLAVPLQLQLLEGDHLDAAYTEPATNGNEIRMGMEFNKAGKIVAYHLLKEHPGEIFYFSSNFADRIRVDASEILNVFRPLRIGQKRGTPCLASVILAQRDLNEFDDAEVVRKKGAALIGGFITETYEDYPGFPQQNPDQLEDPESDLAAGDILGMEPGTYPVLPKGKDIRFSQPADVGGNYEAFTKRQDRRIARGYAGLTYEKFTGDLEGVNYSSIRAGNLEFQRICKQIINNVLVFRFCRPVLVRWLDTAVMSGRVTIPDYLENRRKYLRVKWDIDGWEWVDPEKDTKAHKDGVRSGFETRSQVNGERGRDAELVDQENARDNKRADNLGLVYDSDPRRTNNKGAFQSGSKEGKDADAEE